MRPVGLVLRRWLESAEHRLASLTKLLPKFSWTYTPSANGEANGGYYPEQDPFLKMFKYEYGSSGKEGKLPALKVNSKGKLPPAVHIKGLGASGGVAKGGSGS